MRTERTVVSGCGPLTYTLTRKRIKNYNLRIRQGRIFLSVPCPVTDGQADGFILSRAQWIADALARQAAAPAVPLDIPPRGVCIDILTQALERVLPCVAPLGVTRPSLRVRRMKSQWGNCHYRQSYITLNTALAACPQPLQDYVALHELVHFLHHDHGPGFYAAMDALMPDWKTRRRELKHYTLD